MNWLDIIVIMAIVMSGLFAFSRGFVKEALSIVAWVGAAFAALYGAAYLLPAVARILPRGPVTDTIAIILLFLAVLVVLSLVTSAALRRIKHSGLSAVDRTLGLIFGLIRGMLMVCLAYLALAWALPPENQRQPSWLARARTLPFLETGADQLRLLVPAMYRQKVAAVIGDPRHSAEQMKQAAEAIRALSTPRAPAPRERGIGYTPNDEHELNRLIQQQQGTQ